VSNWGGRRPGSTDLAGPAGRGTRVRIDPRTQAASEGSVSVVDLRSGLTVGEVLTGRHASGLALSPDQRFLVCANAADDTLSVLDTRSDRVVETLWVKPSPAEPFGASPNALAFDAAGRFLYVANGTQNAVAVIRFDPRRRKSKLEGLLPVGWFPAAILHDPRRGRLWVANLKALPQEPVPKPPRAATTPAGMLLKEGPAERCGSSFKGADAEERPAGIVPPGWGGWRHPAASGSDRIEPLCSPPLPCEPPPGAPSAAPGGFGTGSQAPEPATAKHAQGFNSKQFGGTLSLLPVPKTADLRHFTARVEWSLRRERIVASLLPPRAGQPARPVPERIGEPSVFKHVVYVIKENRSYDQVLGDLGKGRGEPSLCIFGEQVTPNQHKLVREFALLDNSYCAGILSADGHNWSTAAFATDYLEKSFAGWPRSYPDGMSDDEVDALAYAPTGFLWDQALKHGKSVRDYGEFAIPRVQWTDPTHKGRPDWLACWRTFLGISREVEIGSEPALESLRPHLAAQTVGWSPEVPDVWKARLFIEELKAFERAGSLPDLLIIGLTNDHTSGTKKGCPTPAATVADNDLAFGQIVEAISHSAFWKDTVIFAIEDDPQNGWDHISGYRTTAYVASPYTRRGEIVSDLYNTTSILRTIEQILGLPPMNQFDASATPMTACFREQPDFTPFVAVPNRVPLDQMNPDPREIADPLLRKQAVQSSRLDFSKPDACPEDLLNRILWHAQKGSAALYPAWAAGTDKN
jgi:hypothetical protein